MIITNLFVCFQHSLEFYIEKMRTIVYLLFERNVDEDWNVHFDSSLGSLDGQIWQILNFKFSKFRKKSKNFDKQEMQRQRHKRASAELENIETWIGQKDENHF